MRRKLSIFLCALFNVLNLYSSRPKTAMTESPDALSVIDPFAGWTAERFQAYEDSLLRTLYPEVHYYNYADSVQAYVENGDLG